MSKRTELREALQLVKSCENRLAHARKRLEEAFAQVEKVRAELEEAREAAVFARAAFEAELAESAS